MSRAESTARGLVAALLASDTFSDGTASDSKKRSVIVTLSVLFHGDTLGLLGLSLGSFGIEATPDPPRCILLVVDLNCHVQ
jgi:hypothetical protein